MNNVRRSEFDSEGEDVKFFLDCRCHDSEWGDRLTLSSGIQPAWGEFVEDAMIPRPPWNSATFERNLVGGDLMRQNFDPGRSVAVVSVNSEILSPLKSYLEMLKLTDLDRSVDHCAVEAYARTAFESLCRRFQFFGTPIFHGLARYLPGLPTVTRNPRTGKFLGLHLDSWERKPVERRSESMNRLSINVGNSVRWFLFVDRTLLGMEKALRRIGFSKRSGCLSDIGPSFMRQMVDYPVKRVKVGPGEAYLAPTDNIIHDGSSESTDGVGMHLTIRGRFKLVEDAWRYDVS